MVVQCSVVMVPRNMGEDHGRHNSVVTPKKKKENKHGGFLSFFFLFVFFSTQSHQNTAVIFPHSINQAAHQ